MPSAITLHQYNKTYTLSKYTNYTCRFEASTLTTFVGLFVCLLRFSVGEEKYKKAPIVQKRLLLYAVQPYALDLVFPEDGTVGVVCLHVVKLIRFPEPS